MERRRVAIDNVYIGPRHREPDDAKVREIAKSIKDVGLMNPPAVVFRDGILVDGEECENVPVLIYGRHRLLALQSLGEVVVECIVHEVDDLHAELMEIDENLARSELSPAQEAAHIARRKAIWEEINGGETRQTLAGLGGRGNKEFASELAAITGDAPSGIRQKIARARKLGPSINLIAGTSLDKGVEMDALIKLPEPERKALIDRAASGEKVTARKPGGSKSKPNTPPHPDDSPATQHVSGYREGQSKTETFSWDRIAAASAAIKAAWLSAPPMAREDFKQWLRDNGELS